MTSSREDPVSLRPEVQTKLPVVDGQAITDDRVVEDTFVNDTSFNMDSFKDMRSWAAGFPEGRIISVTYFSQNSPITDSVTKVADLTMLTQDDTHLSWTQIRNMELRCSQEFSFDYSEESNHAEIATEVVFFPGFIPRVGDIFLYGIRNGRLGVFYISSVKRLALGHETYHTSAVIMKGFLETEFRNRLQKQSTRIVYFDKEKFLVGNTSFLTTDGYIQQKELTHIRLEMIEDYVNRFYSPDMSTFMRPDSVYDPYVIEYWLKKISVVDCNVRPVQLLIAMQNFPKTIWAVLTDHPIKNLSKVKSDFSENIFSSNFWGANITALLGHKYIEVGGDPVSEPNGSYDSDGNFIHKDNYPMGLYNREPFKEMSQRLSEQQFRENRIKFYKGFLPFRTCAPHQHSIEPPAPCDPKDCKEFEKIPHGCHQKKRYLKPPYPVVSNEELLMKWMQLENLTNDTVFTPELQAKFRGYLQWYRESYPGTLSKKELESQWRSEANIPGNQQLSDEQATALKSYIVSYRRTYPRVLNDREVEILWRTKEKIPFSDNLTSEQMVELEYAIRGYREWHGNVPNDFNDLPTFTLGIPITEEEAKIDVQKDLLLERDDINGFIRDPESDTIIQDSIPLVFHMQHPQPHAHVHCHSICHEKCGIGGLNDPYNKNNIKETPTYGLSAGFYQGSSIMDPFERLMYDAITGKDINPALILDAVSRYAEWSDDVAFYRHLFSIYLIDKALFWLRFHS